MPMPGPRRVWRWTIWSDAGALFVGAMLAVICGLACFLREADLATHTISVDHTPLDRGVDQREMEPHLASKESCHALRTLLLVVDPGTW
jgi:hypothetical protein